MNPLRYSIPCLLVAFPGLRTAASEIKPLDSFAGPPSSSEIIAFDSPSKTLFSTFGSLGQGGVQIIDASNPSILKESGRIDLSSVDGLNLRSVSSVAADPLGRGFGVATFIPEASGSNPGKLVFFDPVSRSVLRSLDVGYHPDSVRFSADGTKLFIANEGEPISEGTAGALTHFDRPGSVSVVDLGSVSSRSDVSALGNGHVATYDFSASHLATGVSLDGLRVNPSNAAAASRMNDVEPEYISERNGKLFVSLQENNAVGEFDLHSRQWTAIRPLGTIEQRIDASDRDAGIAIDDFVHGMPMPDGIASLSADGRTFFITANEGDSRPPDFVQSGHPLVADDGRVSQLGSGGRPALDPTYKSELDSLYAGNARATDALGRLTISTTDGLNAAGKIEQLTMFGTRSLSIWDAATGELVWDSGSLFEELTASEVPMLYNSDGTTGSFDTRSDNKGPEPEGLTLGKVGGRTWAFVGLERVGGVVIFDVTKPTSPTFVDYFNTGELSPEGLEFVSAAASPIGVPLLFVGYEVGSRVGVYAVVPESHQIVPAMLGLVALGWYTLRRRRG
ncbi:MAG: choice-of-anchor I family protein, partial [Verrucomicrobiales bacterium]|nr:choice-of-anchor I family protein [Verrucomicrobiales bacterium]